MEIPTTDNIKAICDGNQNQNQQNDASTCLPNPFETFPHLVWEMVLKEVGNSKDICELVKLFPQLDILANRSEILFDRVIVLLAKDLNRKVILDCRAVCQWWKMSVEKFLENHPSRFPYDPRVHSEQTHYRHCELLEKGLDAVNLNGPEGFSDFQQNGHLTSKTAYFVGRSVSFGVDHGPLELDSAFWQINNISDYYAKLSQLLQEHGSNIWKATVPLPGGFYKYQDKFEEYRELVNCLKKLPNLKSLSFDSLKHAFTIMSGNQYYESDNKFTNMASLNPLPVLSNLQELDFSTGMCYAFYYPLSLLSNVFMLKYSRQLRKLSLRFDFWKNCYGSRLRNLTELNLHFVDSVESFPHLVKSLKAPHLQKLGIYSPEIPISDILSAIQNLNLKVVTLHCFDYNYRYCHFPSGDQILPKFQSVTTLEFYHDFINLPSLHFLNSFPSLEYLKIWGSDVPSEFKMLKVIGREILKCNTNCSNQNETAAIWQCFGKLKTLFVDDTCYSREFYEFPKN